MEAIRQRYARLYWKAICMARVPVGRRYGEQSTVTECAAD